MLVRESIFDVLPSKCVASFYDLGIFDNEHVSLGCNGHGRLRSEHFVKLAIRVTAAFVEQLLEDLHLQMVFTINS